LLSVQKANQLVYLLWLY